MHIYRYEYLWADGVHYKRPTPLPARQYISLLMDWVEKQINNEEIFPVSVGKDSNFYVMHLLNLIALIEFYCCLYDVCSCIVEGNINHPEIINYFKNEITSLQK